jgi:FtsP/CotA-like multicopper oxidase with cupredoxin domain
MRFLLCFFLLIGTIPDLRAQQNQLWIPDTLAGPIFKLDIKDTFAQILPGQQTITIGINNKFLGPTLIFNQSDTVRFEVKNKMNEGTTLHWHGLHLPAVMDGGPHQIIPVGSTWKPYWKVDNKAATYWYHPHLHEKTADQTVKGAAGLIIVRDAEEQTLNLPRKYGIDDFPLILQSLQIGPDNQIIPDGMQDSIVLVNGTPKPFLNIPAQKIRLRILNASNARNFNVGFTENIPMYLIATDGGLLGKPLAQTRIRLAPGERAEVLVNFQGFQGSSFQLKSFGSEIPIGTQGGPLPELPIGTVPMKSPLNGLNFNVLELRVGPQIGNPSGALPDSLATQNRIPEDQAVEQRTIRFAPKIPGSYSGVYFVNDSIFKLERIDLSVPLNNVEIWTIYNQTPIAHPFHLHGFEFYILDRYGAAVGPEERGLKDVVLVYPNEQLRIITRFSNYADSTTPYMFHCHLLTHEDDGMMNQFVVKPLATSSTNLIKKEGDFTVFPNPANNRLFISGTEKNQEVYYLKIKNALGRVVLMLPKPELKNGLDIAMLLQGVYFVEITGKTSKRPILKKFVKE